MQLIVGLGNPGKDYQNTRHNAGFWFLDALAGKLGAHFHEETKYQALWAKSGQIHLLKPLTFMNRSGFSVANLANFYRIPPEQILVAHDELDLAVGQVKLKQGGGNAGHNGLKDIQAQLGDGNFWRLRLGIDHPRNSAIPSQPVHDYVLKPPPAGELATLESIFSHILNQWTHLAEHDMKKAVTGIHTLPENM